MTKTEHARSVDQLQSDLRPLLKVRGYKVRGRTFNRVTEDGLTQVISIQMGRSDPPGTTYIPGLRENLHGWFTINLGVCVPEVSRHHGGGAPKGWVQEYHCCIRSRLGQASGEKRDLWWRASLHDAALLDIQRRLEVGGLPFLERHSTRDKILSELRDHSESWGTGGPPRIVMAIILTARGERERARQLLSLQARETRNPRHPEYVRDLAAKLAVGELDG